MINSVARTARLSDETIQPNEDDYSIHLNALIGTRSFLAFDLGYVAEKQSQRLMQEIATSWMPQHPDLQPSSFPVLSYADYAKLPSQDKKLALVIYCPFNGRGQPACWL